ncbi:M-phase inducer phosphatase 1 [Mactra antiquata]
MPPVTRKCFADSSITPKICKMLRFTPDKNGDIDEIGTIITPPNINRYNVAFGETPTSFSVAEGSFTENLPQTSRKPLGRFLSFDVKRSLFSSTKRPADEQTTLEESPATKRLKEAEDAIKAITLNTQSDTSRRENIKTMVQRLSTDNDVIADGSRLYTLPTITGKHSDLKSISPDTMNDVISGCYDDEVEKVTIIDCRYPYEYEGGHIKGAINLYTHTAVKDFLIKHSMEQGSSKKHILIFHCEFSSERGPKMYRHLRSEDRNLNKECYPRLNFPEIYLLDSGYKAFYYKHLSLCSPQAYKPMLHKDHSADLRHFRAKSKSWTAGDRSSSSSRITLKF